MKTAIILGLFLIIGASVASAQDTVQVQPTTFRVKVQPKTSTDKGTRLVVCVSVGPTLTVCTKN